MIPVSGKDDNCKGGTPTGLPVDPSAAVAIDGSDVDEDDDDDEVFIAAPCTAMAESVETLFVSFAPLFCSFVASLPNVLFSSPA